MSSEPAPSSAVRTAFGAVLRDVVVLVGVLTVLGGLVGFLVRGTEGLWGALIGTIFMVTLPELLRGYVSLQHIMFGAILFATMAFLPGGLIEAGNRLLGLLRPKPTDTAAVAGGARAAK